MTSISQDPKTSKFQAFLRKAARYLLGYLLFAVDMVALIFLLFRIRLDTILISDIFEYEIWEIRSITTFTILIIGLIMFAVVAYCEDRLRKAIETNGMWWKVLLRIYLGTAVAWILEICIYNAVVWFVYH
jgi:hypothetical protein